MQNNIKKEKNNYSAIKIGLASSEEIISWSSGEITKPETINYKSLKPEKEGLFDERIFGPSKNYECSCGKYKKIKNKGKTCEKCGVDITEAIVRRQRMGHIVLEEPVTHIWMLRATPSRIALTLEMKTKELEQVVYFVSYIVINPGKTDRLKAREVLDLGNNKSSEKSRRKLLDIINDIEQTFDIENEDHKFELDRAQWLKEALIDATQQFSMDECAAFIKKHTGAEFGIGASAIEMLLKNLNVQEEFESIQDQLKIKKSQTDKRKLMRRMEVLDSFRKSTNLPEWMIMRVIPVIPPDIRPIIQLDGGRFTASEINDLYRRIIIRNERLKKVKEMGAPSIIVNNEKRMLQEAVDALFDNERKPRPVTGRDKRPLKSLTAILKGKQGRFRQNLLGKRVDYSGRSVIAVGPELKMYECGLPREMALTLFKPFLIQKLVEKEIATNLKDADKIIEQHAEEVWESLEEVIKDRPVLLNRAPTLHRLGIQAFEPKIVKGKAIRLHPLVTPAFNADFDGDQMAVHVPISPQAVAEARALMLGSKNILGPKDGNPIVTPTQDMILGNYYLTFEEKNKKGEGSIFADVNEAVIAYEHKNVHLHALIALPVSALEERMFKEKDKDSFIITTIGKIIFNKMFPSSFPFLNNREDLNQNDYNRIIKPGVNIREKIKKIKILQPFSKKTLSEIISKFFKENGTIKTAEMLDNMKNLGFKFSTLSSVTVAASDVTPYDEKSQLFKKGDEFVKEIKEYYEKGMLTETEKHFHTVEKWTTIKNEIQEKLEVVLKQDLHNPIFQMADSGARGNVSNFTQLVGMRGLMNNAKGEVIEVPIKSSFREGLSILEFFDSTHGARKGMADMALKTADSGYLTRRLVDVSQNIIIEEDDCGTDKGFIVEDIVDTKHGSIIVPLVDRIYGRFTKRPILAKGDKVILDENQLITKDLANKVVEAGIKEVEIRSNLTCESIRGVCKKCYGIDLATGEIVQQGEAVGIIAAQSIGEPGTQLTMRTFHTGGVAGGTDITQGLPRIKELVDVTQPKGLVAIISEISGVVKRIQENEGIYKIRIVSDLEEKEYTTQFNATLRVKENQKIEAGQKLTEGAIDLKRLLEVAGVKAVQEYIIKEIQRVYRLQGIEISDKYIEIIVKQMLNKVFILDGGGTELLPGQIVHIKDFTAANEKVFKTNKNPAFGKPVIFGIKKAPLESSSFLSAASFQDTTRVLTKVAIKGGIDELHGLKENVILGNLIPAGTGLKTKDEILEMGKKAESQRY